MTVYGKLELDVPATWADESLLIFKLPPAASTTPMRVPLGDARRPTLVVRRVQLESDVPLDALVEAEERTIEATMQGASLDGARTELTIAGVRALQREIVLKNADVTLRQLYVSLKVEATLVVFCGTALDDVAWKDTRDQFMTVIRSVRL